MKTAKTKPCTVCKKQFMPRMATTKVCSLPCAITAGKEKTTKQLAIRKKIESKEVKQAIENMQPTKYWIAKLQPIFNKFIRERDAQKPCISCGKEVLQYGENWDCGHFRTKGSSLHLRFVEDNAHKQCSSCNRGSEKYIAKRERVATAYEANLILRMGQDRVDAVKSDNVARNYTIDDIKQLITIYKQKIKDLAND